MEQSAYGSGQPGSISAYVQPPWTMKLSHADRERAVEPVKEAYAAGRLDDVEFRRRLDGVMGARTRGDLLPLLRDLPDAYGPAGAPAAPETFRAAPPAAAARPAPGERGWAVAAHVLGLGTSFVGPLLVSRSQAAQRSAYVRRQAVQAANFQLTVVLALLAVGVLAGVTFGVAGVLTLPLSLAWLALTGLGAARAADGLEFRHPLTLRLLH